MSLGQREKGIVNDADTWRQEERKVSSLSSLDTHMMRRFSGAILLYVKVRVMSTKTANGMRR